MTRVDVGMLTWNSAEMTVRSLRRLLDTEQGCELRVLVRDNGSSDGTVDLLAERVPEAEVDAGTTNLGFAAGVNTLLRRSDAPWFFLLNSDAWPEPGAIGRLVAAAERHERAAAVAPKLVYPDGRLQHSTHPFPSLRVAAITAFAWDRIPRERAEDLFLEGAWMHDTERRIDWALGAALLLRRAAVEEIGGLDERFFFYAEDLEWCWRARQAGWEIWFEPQAVVTHILNASGAVLFGGMRSRAHIHNALRFYRRAHGLASAAAWWSLNVAGCALRAIGAAARRDRGGMRAWWEQTVANLVAPFTRERGLR